MLGGGHGGRVEGCGGNVLLGFKCVWSSGALRSKELQLQPKRAYLIACPIVC